MRVKTNLWYNSLNWSYLYDADAFFQCRVLIRILELISIPNHSRETFISIIFEYFTLMECVCECQFKFVVITHLIGHIFMMQMLSFNFGFDSDSRHHFHSKSFQRFIYFNKIEYFTLMERVCESQNKFVV